MPTMAELLTDEQARRLNAIQFPTEPVAQPTTRKASKPASKAPKHERQCDCPRRHDGFTRDGDLLVHKACGRPLPTVSVLRGASAVPVVVPCAGGCGCNVTIATRKGVTDEPRVATCADCARAIATGSSVTVVSRTKPAAPIGVTTKENRVSVNIDTIPSAKLGETIKEAERERLAAEMPAKVAKAKKKRAKADKAQVKAKKRERRDLSAMGVLPGFGLLGVEVPALDVAGLANLAEIPNAKARSPYNKVRYREGLPLLSHMEEPGVGDACTWATLLAEHQRMLAVAQEQPKAESKGKGKAKAQISAPIDLAERMKIEAIMQAVGCSEKKARKILASV